MSSDLSAEITAIATVVLAVFAIVTGIYAIRAFRKQSREVSDQASMLQVQSEQLAEQRKVNAEQIRVLALQAAELRESLKEREREAYERTRALAERVFIGAPHAIGQQVSPYAMNASDLPVFGAQLWSIGSRGLSDPADLGVILPGERVSTPDLVFETEDDALASTVLTFRDATSRQWVRLPDGALKKQTLNTTRDSILAILGKTGLAEQEQENAPGG